MRHRWLAVATVFMSVPLLASYQIKHWPFGPGYGFVALYVWGLIAVPVLPVLLLSELALILITLRRHADRIAVRTHTFAAILGVSAEAVFLYVRSYA
jgi:hypothetical protein